MFANMKTPSNEHKYLFEDSLKKDKKKHPMQYSKQ